jgi:LPPG:FO 2-phospho-L-lactate transferase
MAAALRTALSPDSLTVVVNVGDDSERYGVHVAADLDTVAYTLAGVQGPHGWGRADDTHRVMGAMDELGVDTRFRLGDRDLAACLLRTQLLRSGMSLTEATRDLAGRLGIDGMTIVPASDDPVRTWVETLDAGWLDFQTYFVDRGHRDDVLSIAYHGSVEAEPAPGVVEAIEAADTVVVAPSNPPLSIWPILAIGGIARAVKRHPRVVGVSPLFSGKALKGPADAVMRSVGLSEGTSGVLEAYEGIIDALVIDRGDADDVALASAFGVPIIVAGTRLTGPDGGRPCVDAVLGREAA